MKEHGKKKSLKTRGDNAENQKDKENLKLHQQHKKNTQKFRLLNFKFDNS